MKHLLPLAFILLTTIASFAQETLFETSPLLRHEMTPEEWLRRGEIGRGFVETDPPVAPARNIAEFERMHGVLIRYPFGIPVSLIKEMATDAHVTTIVASQSQQNTVINQYVANGVDTSHCDFLIAASNSYWTRDFGPWFGTDSSGQVGIIDFPYNRPRPADDEIPKLFATMMGLPWYGMNVIHTGGNYMCDGHGVGSSTDLVYVENPSQTSAQVDEKMNQYLGITNHQVVPDPNISSTIDHIDCWAKFLAPDKILIRKTLPTDPEYSALESAAAYWATQVSSYGYPYKVFRVMTPSDQPYSNSVILNNKVLVPFMNSAWDDSAKAVYEAAMPGYEVIGFLGNPSTPWLSTDALHCRVMGVADPGLLRITHLPLFGNQPAEYACSINAEIIASSMQPVTDDSVRIFYRVNGGTWQATGMQHTDGRHYAGTIPAQPAGSEVEYYLTAADASGRTETMPLIGAADPFRYNTIYTNLTPVPDTLWFRTLEDCGLGKTTHLINQTASPLSLTFMQETGYNTPWYVDSLSVFSLPAQVPPGSDVSVLVKLPILLAPVADTIWVADTMHFTTNAGNYHLTVMVNHDLLTSLQGSSGSLLSGEPWPNPFREILSIPIQLYSKQRAVLQIYDLQGREIMSLPVNDAVAGKQTILWNGLDRNGRVISAGIYLLRITSDNRTLVKKIVKSGN